MPIRIGKKSAKHLYNVEVMHKDGRSEIIEVDADTRIEARILAEKAGYIVASINFVG